MATILVIDDEESMREILTRVLERAGHQVVSVDDGIHAKSAISQHKPDLIICDILMPKLDGHALVYDLKFEHRLKDTPIMLLTSLGDEKKYLGDEVAADFYMAKPFDNAELVKKVEELLNAGRVKIGVKPENGHRGSIGKSRKKAAAKMLRALSGALAALALLFLISSRILNFGFDLANPGMDNARYLSLLSDKVFIAALPIAIAVFLYQTYLLKNLASRQAVNPADVGMSPAANGRNSSRSLTAGVRR